jgi:hypothetical protein
MAFLRAGALVVHELRYRIAFGDDAPAALGGTGHGYLYAVTPIVSLVAMLAIAVVVVQRLARGAATSGVRRRRIWLVLTGCLVGIFCAQELLEGMLATGHHDGLEGILGHGGWLAVPVSMAVAAVGLVFVRLAARAPLRGIVTTLVRALPLPEARGRLAPGRRLVPPDACAASRRQSSTAARLTRAPVRPDRPPMTARVAMWWPAGLCEDGSS